MKPISVEYNNLFSIDHEILNLKEQGLVLVTGFSEDERDSNGSGKSSLTSNGLSWVRYGRIPYEEAPVPSDSVINRHTGRQTAWGREVFSSKGKNYLIHRQRKPNKLQLFVQEGQEWTNISAKESSATQELINQVLGKDFKTFVQTDIFGQGRSTSYLSLPPAQRKAVLEQILPFDSLDPYIELAKKKVRDTKGRVEELTLDLRDQHTHLQTLKTARTQLVSKEKSFLTEQQERISALNAEISQAKAAPDRTEIEGKISALEKWMQQAKAFIETEPTPEYCEKCNQVIPSDQLIEIKKNREYYREAQVKLQRLKHELALSNVQISSIETKLVEVKEQTSPYGPLLKENEIEVRNVEQIIPDIQKRLKDQTEHLGHLEFWSSAFASDMKTLMFIMVCPLLEQRTQEHLRQLCNEQIQVKFSTIKHLADGSVKEDFSVEVESTSGGNTFGLFSGGEKQMVNFAIGLALADVAQAQAQGGSQLLILDEPFVQLGPKNCQSVVDYLQQLAFVKDTILLVSNESNLAGLIPNHLKVVKTNGRSRIIKSTD